MNILLPYPDNFKKCAKTLSDEQLKLQILDIDNIYYFSIIFDDTTGKKETKSEVIDWYQYQLKWLCKYQLALMTEYRKRTGKEHSAHCTYKNRLRRILSLPGRGALYRIIKWEPALFIDEKRQGCVNKKEIGQRYRELCQLEVSA